MLVFQPFNRSTLQHWLRQYHGEIRGNTLIASAIKPEQRRIQELEKQVRQLQSDNDRLKKASAFFAMEMNNDINALGVVAIHAVENPKSGEY